MEIDILTARPRVFNDKKEMLAFEEKRLQSEISKGMEAERRLDTEDGKYFVSILEAALSQRIDELAQNDPKASAILHIMAQLGAEINIGRGATKRLLEMRLRK